MIINGEAINFKGGITITEMLEELKLDSNKVVVEVDLEIINKDEFSVKILSTDSKVEIIRFVGGG
ncbi:sulfur carrier protein ThiS [Clostridium sp. DJ247]|uniref:sulfur carrier protein ThiS n=1 Tax=Clostridium sp. DJ247 TaxID=2726188 RepID=UPI001626275A|nr:sulfur carrier protein ThiS [Clostridium sp. DJ247]MBC2581837.1 sulfur carrier protein ThiS [Clostridium sp. DJ247]